MIIFHLIGCVYQQQAKLMHSYIILVACCILSLDIKYFLYTIVPSMHQFLWIIKKLQWNLSLFEKIFLLQCWFWNFRNITSIMFVLWQSGPCEITTRWTMTMKFALLPWKPELIFTGLSIMGINPDTGKFISHVVC